MESKEKKLTNEHLRSKFKSQFEMVNCAIHRAEEMIKRGEQASSSHTENVALHVIRVIGDEAPQEFIAGFWQETIPEDTMENGVEVDEFDDEFIDIPPSKKTKRK